MTLYSVFERSALPREAPVVVPDRFSWSAALLPPVYLLVRGLWLELLAFVLLFVAIVAAGYWLGGTAAFWIYVLLAVFLGFEAPGLWRRALRRQGWYYRSELIAPAADLAQLEWLRRRRAAP